MCYTYLIETLNKIIDYYFGDYMKTLKTLLRIITAVIIILGVVAISNNVEAKAMKYTCTYPETHQVEDLNSRIIVDGMMSPHLRPAELEIDGRTIPVRHGQKGSVDYARFMDNGEIHFWMNGLISNCKLN